MTNPTTTGASELTREHVETILQGANGSKDEGYDARGVAVGQLIALCEHYLRTTDEAREEGVTGKMVDAACLAYIEWFYEGSAADTPRTIPCNSLAMREALETAATLRRQRANELGTSANSLRVQAVADNTAQWESGELGCSAEHARRASPEDEAAIADALGINRTDVAFGYIDAEMVEWRDALIGERKAYARVWMNAHDAENPLPLYTAPVVPNNTAVRALPNNERTTAGEVHVFDKICADALADEVAVLVKRGVIDMRSPAADALLDYRDPPSSPRADRLAQLERSPSSAPAVSEGWQPVSTVPKDGMFLVVNTRGHMFVMAGEILERQRTAKHPTPEHLRFDVTHWMPLPASPEYKP